MNYSLIRYPFILIGFISASGLAVDGDGNLFTSLIIDEVDGYPISIFSLIFSLVIISFKILINKLEINYGKLFYLILILLILTSALTIGQLLYVSIDINHFIKYNVWVLALLVGIVIGVSGHGESVYWGINTASYFVIFWGLLDIILELYECGLLLCGGGRVAPGFGIPGIYQEYTYFSTLIVFLICFKYYYNGLNIIHLLAGFIVVLSTGSREGLFLFICVFLLVYSIQNYRILLIIPFLVFSSIYLIYYFEIEIAILTKIAEISGELEGSNSRLEIFISYLELISENILFGNYFFNPSVVGGNFYTAQPSAHNNYIDILAAGGLYLALIYSIIFCLIFLCLAKIKTRLSSALLIYLSCFLIISMNVNVPIRSPLIVIPLFMTIGIILSRIKIR